MSFEILWFCKYRQQIEYIFLVLRHDFVPWIVPSVCRVRVRYAGRCCRRSGRRITRRRRRTSSIGSGLGDIVPDMAEQCIAQVRKWSGDGSICKQNQTAMRILGQINEGLKDCGPEPESFIDQFTASNIGVKRVQEDVAEQEEPQQAPQQQQAPQLQASPPSQLQSPQRQYKTLQTPVRPRYRQSGSSSSRGGKPAGGSKPADTQQGEELLVHIPGRDSYIGVILLACGPTSSRSRACWMQFLPWPRTSVFRRTNCKFGS